MYFDWRTWGIWFIGLVILIIWIFIPIREFKKVLEKKRHDLNKNNHSN